MMSSGFSPLIFASKATFPRIGSFSRSALHILTTRSLQLATVKFLNSNKSPGIEPFSDTDRLVCAGTFGQGLLLLARPGSHAQSGCRMRVGPALPTLNLHFTAVGWGWGKGSASSKWGVARRSSGNVFCRPKQHLTLRASCALDSLILLLSPFSIYPECWHLDYTSCPSYLLDCLHRILKSVHRI